MSIQCFTSALLRCTLVLAAAAHLTIVILGAAGITLPDRLGFAARALSVYEHYTGAGAGFGFFAPAVPDEVLPVVTALDRSGHAARTVLGTRSTSEADLRTSSLTFLYAKTRIVDLYGRSIAAYVMGQNGSVDTVLVTLGFYELPSMRAYAAGARPAYRPFFRGTFRRS
ncbi:MAG: hypothetical protein QOI11_1763 [Candidatus Eremiobacteraeota bacterium]|jgi:hypothetical protein|nr:hypothetical protein [Candidatus Eremiobacteraeota bacterium]